MNKTSDGDGDWERQRQRQIERNKIGIAVSVGWRVIQREVLPNDAKNCLFLFSFVLCCAIFLHFCIAVFLSHPLRCHRFSCRYRFLLLRNFCNVLLISSSYSLPFFLFLPFTRFRAVNPSANTAPIHSMQRYSSNNLLCAFSNVTTSAKIALFSACTPFHGELHGMKRNQYTVVINIEKASLWRCTYTLKFLEFRFRFSLFSFWFLLLLLYTAHNDFYYAALSVCEK